MTYNVHPIFVHFPIALLFLYSVIKIIPLYKWFPRVAWRQIERALLIFGVLGAFAALYTGGIAEHLVKPEHDLVEMHSAFAVTAVWIYVVLLVGEVLSIFAAKVSTVRGLPQIQRCITHPIVGRVLAFCGLVAITIAGLLGGVMVYGTTADPFAAIVLKWLGLE